MKHRHILDSYLLELFDQFTMGIRNKSFKNTINHSITLSNLKLYFNDLL